MIVVTTPTGQIGREVVARLLDAGEGSVPVRVIARDPAALAPQVRERVEVVHGSHADPVVLKEACQGADQVFWLVPPTSTAPDSEAHYGAFTDRLCEVIEAQGTKRVVAVSTLGRGVAQNAGLISTGLAMDERIAATGVHYRALCPPALMENTLRQLAAIRDTGVFDTSHVADRVLRLCATRDVGAAAARLLLDDSWTGRADVPLVGPDDLTPEGMAAVLAEVLGRPVRTRFAPVTELRAGLLRAGATEDWVRSYTAMVTAQNEQGFYGASQLPTPGLAPTTFRQWCEEVLRPAAES
ncbi:NAD(P)H-binding protein [Streptomyces sp. NBC_01485]|uniref:NAD(P)H-binding protein n=1 Tax=Streptomyces sp. NBC_01485 TaxID=2903884 RepID=UPI002E2EC2AB|nr:NAD(P)H-binding protein [Streptomyces sp. NBC_01485]